jgi:hypothetical protein
MTNKLSAKEKIESLVIRFEDQYESYKHSDYNETLTRRDFIDPFFKALGWDMDNEAGYAEAYREVIHEDKVKVSGATKAPDYSFRLGGGKRLFFVEAKKPSVSVKDDIQPAYQVRRYGWSAKMPISIITDFEEFSIYDCTKKPKPEDKAAVARIKFLSFRDYIKEFDFLWDTFSKEQVLKGSFDKFLLSDTHKKGTATVDKDFLESLDRWRTYLAVNISWNNRTLEEDEINFVVQQTIDRIIFLRIAEDRSVETYGTLKHAIKQGNLYQNLFELFQRADEKYNSGLFDFKKDKISRNVVIENKIIRTIINELYYPECPYEFSVLSVEILGSAYEQFLGKVIRITPAHHAKIEEKPEVRKAGGVYYTPQYIVDYIVKNTVGKLIEGKTPKEISKIKILDPACGSGSFLIGAFQYLLDYHKDYYSENGKPSKGRKDNPLTPDGHLTTAEKKRILLNNIYGVDLDSNAVEVTKLSLLIKCLEGETEASIKQQLAIWNERVLPTLENNIKSGNSLIDTDFYDNQLDFGDLRKIKPFSWTKAFQEIFADTDNPGFNLIIGNPPYVAIEGIEQTERTYYATKYPDIKKRLDLFGLFLDRALKLLDNNGILGFIIPMQFLRNSAFEFLRKSILIKHHLIEINYVGDKVFENAKNDTIILIIGKKRGEGLKTKLFESTTTKSSIKTLKSSEINQKIFLNNRESTYDLSSGANRNIFQKIESQDLKITNRFSVIQGIVSGLNQAYIYHKDNTPKVEKRLLKKFAFGSDFEKYSMREINYSILYLNKEIKIKDYPLTEELLATFKKALEKRREVRNNAIPWYSLQWPRNPKTFERPKILFQKIRNQKLRDRLVGTYDESGLYLGDGVIYLNSNTDNKNELKFLLALLNSSLYNFYFREQFLDINLKIKYLENTPLIDYTQFSKTQLITYNEIISLVDKLLSLHSELYRTTLQTKIEQIKTQIIYCQDKIDASIYELYALTQEEIKQIMLK